MKEKTINSRFQFRVWNIVNKQFSYPGDKQFLIGLDGRLFDGDGNSYDEHHIIQEYTGLNDENGVKIFDGDIIEYYFNDKNILHTCVVKWEHYGFVLFDIYDESSIPLVYIDNTKVIGNIFEPPCQPDHNG